MLKNIIWSQLHSALLIFCLAHSLNNHVTDSVQINQTIFKMSLPLFQLHLLFQLFDIPVATFLSCVADIKYPLSVKLSQFKHLMHFLCFTVNKMWVCEICKSLRSVLFWHFTEHPNLFGNAFVFTYTFKLDSPTSHTQTDSKTQIFNSFILSLNAKITLGTCNQH